MVGHDVVDVVRSVFHSRKLLRGINHTHITLVPKVKCPMNMTQLRPISLCNVTYKILSKVLANRLCVILPTIISENQSAFVSGRYIMDNILIGQEVLHHLKNKRKGQKYEMATKMDMSKAYDQVEWIFLEKIMLKMGFDQRWVQWIMECISPISYSVIVNGEATSYIRPSRGIRQGDPLPPYLFLICG